MPRVEPAMPKFSIQQDDGPASPTPERLAAANDNFVIDRTTRAYTMRDTPCDRLHRAGKIDDTQLEAARRYYADWYAAGNAPLGAVDYERPVVDGSSPKGESDYRLGALARWRGHRDALGRLGVVVDNVVLLEAPLAAAGAAAGVRGESQMRAVASFALLAGLDLLARRYGLVGGGGR